MNDDPKVYTCDVCGEEFWLRPSLKEGIYNLCMVCHKLYEQVYIPGNVTWELREKKYGNAQKSN